MICDNKQVNSFDFETKLQNMVQLAQTRKDNTIPQDRNKTYLIVETKLYIFKAKTILETTEIKVTKTTRVFQYVTQLNVIRQVLIDLNRTGYNQSNF